MEVLEYGPERVNNLDPLIPQINALRVTRLHPGRVGVLASLTQPRANASPQGFVFEPRTQQPDAAERHEAGHVLVGLGS